jgi:hypothetical protein
MLNMMRVAETTSKRLQAGEPSRSTGSSTGNYRHRRRKGGGDVERVLDEKLAFSIVKLYRDHGISGAKGRDKRPSRSGPCC